MMGIGTGDGSDPGLDHQELVSKIGKGADAHSDTAPLALFGLERSA